MPTVFSDECNSTPEDRFLVPGQTGRVTAVVGPLCETVNFRLDSINDDDSITFTFARENVLLVAEGSGVYAFQQLLSWGEVFEVNVNGADGSDFYIKVIEVDRTLTPSVAHLRIKTAPFAESCGNRIDDDNDGRIDCADDECFGDSICRVPVVDPIDDVLRQIGIVLRDADSVYPGTLSKISAIARILRDYFASLG